MSERLERWTSGEWDPLTEARARGHRPYDALREGKADPPPLLGARHGLWRCDGCELDLWWQDDEVGGALADVTCARARSERVARETLVPLAAVAPPLLGIDEEFFSPNSMIAGAIQNVVRVISRVDGTVTELTLQLDGTLESAGAVIRTFTSNYVAFSTFNGSIDLGPWAVADGAVSLQLPLPSVPAPAPQSQPQLE